MQNTHKEEIKNSHRYDRSNIIQLFIIPIVQALAPNITWVVGGSQGLSLTTLFMDMYLLYTKNTK